MATSKEIPGRFPGFKQTNELIDELRIRLNLTKGFDTKLLKYLPGSFFFGLFGPIQVTGQNRHEPSVLILFRQGPFPFHPVDPQRRRRSHPILVDLAFTSNSIRSEITFLAQ